MDGAPPESRVIVHKGINSCEFALKSRPHILMYIVPDSSSPILEESISEDFLIIEEGTNIFKGLSLYKQHVVTKILG